MLEYRFHRMTRTMKVKDEDRNLYPQPFPCINQLENLDINEELKLNKKRLTEAKRQMKVIKEQICKYSQILIKEIGCGVTVKDLMLRNGQSPGWLGRAQTIMTLKLKLTSTRSKCLDPPHKIYYRGPFNSKKEFDLKCLPEKQETLYKTMLEEKKRKILQRDKPVDTLKKELTDLKLMYKAARFRNQSLLSKVNGTIKKLEKMKEKASVDLRIVEGMMAHQSLYKMMIDQETFELDPALKKYIKDNPESLGNVPQWTKFKKMLQKSEKESDMYRETAVALTQKLDKINNDLLEAEQINCQNIIRMEKRKVIMVNEEAGNIKQKAKDSENISRGDSEFSLLERENQQLREFILSSVLSAEDDLKMFTNMIEYLRKEFVRSLIIFEKKDE